MEAMLEATGEPRGHSCTLARFTEAFRQGDIVPSTTEQESRVPNLNLALAVNALTNKALDRAGAIREDIRRQRLLHRQTG